LAEEWIFPFTDRTIKDLWASLAEKSEEIAVLKEKHKKEIADLKKQNNKRMLDWKALMEEGDDITGK
jgi:hypothetical protein